MVRKIRVCVEPVLVDLLDAVVGNCRSSLSINFLSKVRRSSTGWRMREVVLEVRRRKGIQNGNPVMNLNETNQYSCSFCLATWSGMEKTEQSQPGFGSATSKTKLERRLSELNANE